jgi:transcriptional regulator with XRE-family HTH domain
VKTPKNYAPRSAGGRTLEQYIGTMLRDIRLRHRLTIADVAYRVGISKGMVSKLETGQTSASLETLAQITNALGITLSNLFRDFNMPTGSAQYVKKGEGMEVVRHGTKKGHTYHLLAFSKGPKKIFDPFLVTINNKSEVFPSFEHPGTEFMYILEGKIKYRHGKQTFTLSPGDAITFAGKIPHGPEQLIKLPIRMLSIIIYHGDEETEP